VTSTTWARYTYNFYLPTTDVSALFHFDVGTAPSGDVIGLDGVALTPLDANGYALPTPVAPVPTSYVRGVNVLGGTQGLCCGTSVFASGAQLDYLKAKGFTRYREQIAWKLLQPTPYGPLDTGYLGQMDTEVRLAAARGEQIAFDPWDRENGQGQGSVPLGQLQDLWTKLVTHYAAAPTLMAGIWGWDLLNEPSSVSGTLFANDAWNVQYVPALIQAIRRYDTSKIIFAPTSTGGYGMYWSSHLTGLPFHDPANKLVYEAHFYFDKNAGATSGTIADCTNENGTYGAGDSATQGAPCPDNNVGVTHLSDFASWCDSQRVTCDVGEYGVPGGIGTGSGASCTVVGSNTTNANFLTQLSNFMNALDAHNLWATAWEAGPFGDTNDLGPTCGADGTTPNGPDRPQLAVLTQHLSGANAPGGM